VKRARALLAHVRLPLLLLMIVTYVLAQSYAGRVELRDSQVRGCHRSQQDRAANARGWRIAEHARRASGETKVADAYAEIATGLEQRSRIDCERAFPAPSLIPR
jgi:hypothetical protein